MTAFEQPVLLERPVRSPQHGHDARCTASIQPGFTDGLHTKEQLLADQHCPACPLCGGNAACERAAKNHPVATGQRSMIAARLAMLKQGARTDLSSIELMSQADAAALLNVSVSSIKRASKVLNEGTPEDIAAVETGEKGVSTIAYPLVSLRRGRAFAVTSSQPEAVSL